jgi:hypothetical protein
MIVAHIAGIPLEELLSLAPAAGALWLALRASSTLGRVDVTDTQEANR